MKKELSLIFVIAASMFSGALSAQRSPITVDSAVRRWRAEQFKWNMQIDSAIIAVARSSYGGVTCGGSFAGTKHGHGAKTPNVDTSADSCQMMINWALTFDQENEFTQEFDTAKYIIQHCVNSNTSVALEAVGRMSIATNQGGGGPLPQAWINERNYLLALFQLRPGDGSWLCGICNQLIGCMSDGDIDTSWQQVDSSTNRGLSLVYWLIHNSPCSQYGTNDTETYVGSRQSEYESYLSWPNLNRDSVPFDTTIYTMQQLGLDSVLKYFGMLGVNEGTAPSIITNPTAYPNPTGEGTVISFGIAREAYVAINLYDVLGHQVSTAGFGGVVEPGNLSVPISLVGLPAGTYFARIQTTYGETQTVKLVKE
jgi:hypothetical protein